MAVEMGVSHLQGSRRRLSRVSPKQAMQLAHNMTRLRPGDLEDLTVASTKLVEAASAIAAWKSPAAALIVALLRDANDIVLRIRDRGLARMQTVLGKMGDELDQQARAKAAAEGDD